MTTATAAVMPAQGLRDYKIMGIPLPIFLILTSVVFLSAYLQVLPKGMVGAFPQIGRAHV